MDWFAAAKPDVLCIQETKAQPDQIENEPFEKLGYQCYWNSAERKGYSGTGLICKTEPKHVEVGMGIPEFDAEGRVLRADFDNISVMSVYVPSATNMDRLPFKLDFCHAFLKHLIEVQKEHPNLVVNGDFNICHEAIDIHDPVRLATVSGFLPVEREYLTEFLKDGNFTDAFRFKNPEKVEYSWWSYRGGARASNKGWRLDYNMVTNPIQNKIERAIILPEAQHSDHCPVMVEIGI